MKTIHVQQFSGLICMDPDEGLKLFGAIKESLHRGLPVHLDFSGVTVLASSYLNAAIGSLYGEFSPEVLRDRLTFAGLSDDDRSVMSVVQTNAIDFYSASPDKQRRLIEQ